LLWSVAVTDVEKETIKIKAANFYWMRSSLLASVDAIEFQITDGYSSLDLTRVRNNIYIGQKYTSIQTLIEIVSKLNRNVMYGV
jgi:hypothetical protein